MDQPLPNPQSNPPKSERGYNPPAWFRKYSFAILGILSSFFVLYLVHIFAFPEKLGIISVIATDLVILVTTVTDLTGTAKIEISALYGRPGLTPPASPVVTAVQGIASKMGLP